MRGKAFANTIAVQLPGITPAYAGKRYAHPATIIHEEDHPRLCGEKLSQFYDMIQKRGSPPPMRGKE